MIKVWTGVPGSGKSYGVVKYILDNYATRGEDGAYRLNESVHMISNIEDLKLDCLHLQEILNGDKVLEAAEEKGVSPVEAFFSYEYQQYKMHPWALKNKKTLLYVIDECQEFFPAGFKDPRVHYFFQKHRHMGVDILLMTQHIGLISSGIRALIEMEISAAPSSKRAVMFDKFFLYYEMVGRTQTSKNFVTKEKRVFDAYKSFDAQSKEKAKNPYKWFFIIFPILLILAVKLFMDVFTPPPEAAASSDPSSYSADIDRLEKMITDLKTSPSYSLDENLSNSPGSAPGSSSPGGYVEMELDSYTYYSGPRGAARVFLRDPYSGQFIDGKDLSGVKVRPTPMGKPKYFLLVPAWVAARTSSGPSEGSDPGRAEERDPI